QAAALLGRALLALGRPAEAEALSHESEALAGDDLKAAIAWRGVRAEALARRGEHGAAVGFARAAVDIAAATDALLDHADARLALAAALRAADRNDDAAAEEARAIELWEAKGAALLVARASHGIGGVEPADDEPTAEAAVGPASVRITNAATRAVDRFRDAWATRDWDRVAALFPPRFLGTNRRRMLQIELDRDHYLAMLRPLFEMTSSQTINVLATRGERLALVGIGWEGADDVVGPSEIVGLGVIDVDERGDYLALVMFDRDDLESAHAELDARYDRGEAAFHQAEVTRTFRR